MLVRVGRALLGALMGVCITQAASATDFVFPTTTTQSQGPNWAGFYLKSDTGAGGAPWTNSGTASGFSSLGAATPAVSDSFGYNFQSGNFVFGLEGSLSAANFDGKFTAPYFPATAGWSPNMNWLGTVTGRLGYVAGQWLPYVKGGFAAADIGSPLQGSPVGGFSQGTEVTGWTAGVGVEYQLGSKWSLGLEYLYTDLGNGNAGGPPNTIGTVPLAGSPEVYSTALKTQSLLGRLNYKTGW
jgi:outer membrane immunogenic protein